MLIQLCMAAMLQHCVGASNIGLHCIYLSSIEYYAYTFDIVIKLSEVNPAPSWNISNDHT